MTWRCSRNNDAVCWAVFSADRPLRLPRMLPNSLGIGSSDPLHNFCRVSARPKPFPMSHHVVKHSLKDVESFFVTKEVLCFPCQTNEVVTTPHVWCFDVTSSFFSSQQFPRWLCWFSVGIGVLPNRPAVSTDPNLTLLFILRIWCDPHQIVNAKDGDGSLWKLGTSWVTPGGTHNGSVQIWMQSNTGYHCFRLQRSSDCRILKAPRSWLRCRFTLQSRPVSFGVFQHQSIYISNLNNSSDSPSTVRFTVGLHISIRPTPTITKSPIFFGKKVTAEPLWQTSKTSIWRPLAPTRHWRSEKRTLWSEFQLTERCDTSVFHWAKVERINLKNLKSRGCWNTTSAQCRNDWNTSAKPGTSKIAPGFAQCHWSSLGRTICSLSSLGPATKLIKLQEWFFINTEINTEINSSCCDAWCLTCMAGMATGFGHFGDANHVFIADVSHIFACCMGICIGLWVLFEHQSFTSIDFSGDTHGPIVPW